MHLARRLALANSQLEYFRTYSLYADDFHRPILFKELVLLPKLDWKDAPPILRLCPDHLKPSDGPCASRNELICRFAIGTDGFLPGNRGELRDPGIRCNTSNKTLIGSRGLAGHVSVSIDIQRG